MTHRCTYGGTIPRSPMMNTAVRFLKRSTPVALGSKHYSVVSSLVVSTRISDRSLGQLPAFLEMHPTPALLNKCQSELQRELSLTSQPHSLSVRHLPFPSVHPYLLNGATLDCTGSTTAGLKWLQREGYGFADTYSKIQRPLDGLKVAYDQKLRYSTLQFSVPPELGRNLPGLPVPYDECGVIYCLIADPEKENRGVYSQRIDGDFSRWFFFVVPELLIAVRSANLFQHFWWG